MGSVTEDDSGEGADEDSDAKVDGWGKLIRIPCTPIVQSKYDDASSKSVSRDMLLEISCKHGNVC